MFVVFVMVWLHFTEIVAFMASICFGYTSSTGECVNYVLKLNYHTQGGFNTASFFILVYSFSGINLYIQ